MNGQLFLLLLVAVAVISVASTVVFVVVLNRVIGRHYDRQALALAPLLAAEGVRFAEAGCPLRTTARALFAVGASWSHADVQVTARGVYLLQYRQMFGRQGQPIVAIARAREGLSPHVAPLVSEFQPVEAPRFEGPYVFFPCRRGRVSLTFRVECRALPALRAALDS